MYKPEGRGPRGCEDGIRIWATAIPAGTTGNPAPSASRPPRHLLLPFVVPQFFAPGVKSLDAVGVDELEDVCHIRSNRLAACRAEMLFVGPRDTNRLSRWQITDRRRGQKHTKSPPPTLFLDPLLVLDFLHPLIL